MFSIPIVIPAYEPDENLINLLKDLKNAGLGPVVLVDDGSGEKYRHLFERAQEEYQCQVLKHAVNMGKGRALKSAFNYLINEYKEEELLGCLTADSDGQHGVKDIKRCREALEENPQKLILGCRDFDLPSVPSKSRFGNKLTHHVCKWLCGVDVSDTQTGLRAIPREFMKFLLNTPGERFEFETNMLLDSKGRAEIEEVKIETIYDSKDHHATHFHPVRDSLKIYKIFGRCFLKFLVSSLSSSVVDLVFFSIFCRGLKTVSPLWYVAAATVLARVISGIYNYLLNYKLVFKSTEKYRSSLPKYFLLAVCQMSLSAFFVTGIVRVLGSVSETAVKIVVDIVLFFISYKVQQEYIFKGKNTVQQ